MKNYSFLILFITSILIISCSTNYFGTYSSKIYISEIEINKANVICSGSSGVFAQIVQKESYKKNGSKLYVDFIIKDTTKSYIYSYLDKHSDDIKISIKAIFEKDTLDQYVKVIINDSLSYVHDKDTIFKKILIKKIALKHNGLEFINDTILYFPEKNEDNVYKLFIRTRKVDHALAKKGKHIFKIKGKKIIEYKYDTLFKEYKKSKYIYYRKTRASFNHEYDSPR